MNYYVLRSKLPAAPGTHDYVGRVLNVNGVVSVEFVELPERAQRWDSSDLAQVTADFLLEENCGPFYVRRVGGE